MPLEFAARPLMAELRFNYGMGLGFRVWFNQRIPGPPLNTHLFSILGRAETGDLGQVSFTLDNVQPSSTTTMRRFFPVFRVEFVGV